MAFMVDPSVVATKLHQVEQYYGELQDKQHLSRKRFLTDITEQRAVERMFENTIQACIDLSKHIATTEFDYDGDSSKQAVEVLEANGVIRNETATTLKDAVGFRNLLAHEYGRVNPDNVYQYLQTDLRLYDEFSQQVASWVDEHGLESE